MTHADDILAAKDKEIHELKVELAKWVNYWRDKDIQALQDRIAALEAACKLYAEIIIDKELERRNEQ